MENETVNSTVLSRLEDNHTILMRLENESIQALAIAHPRDHKAIVLEMVSQMEAYPAFAEDCIYSKPVGKDEKGNMKYARGLSIRAAEALAALWKYNRIRCEIESVDEDRARITATFTDLQSGRVWQDVGIISKYYKAKGGKIVRHDDDRFANIVCKAEASRRIREVILRSVAPGIRLELQAAAEREMAKVLSGDAVSKIVSAFQQIGVDLAKLEAHVGRSLQLGWTNEDRVDLLGMFNAIKAGETTVAEAFAAPQDETKQPSPAKTLAQAVDEAVAKS